MRIREFKADRECEKCGSREIEVLYDERHDHLRKTCLSCSHHWLEYPRDHRHAEEFAERRECPSGPAFRGRGPGFGIGRVVLRRLKPGTNRTTESGR